MRTIVCRLGLWLLISLASVLLDAQANIKTSFFVHTSGTKLVTGSGEAILLRGINLGNWLEPEGYMFHFDGGPQAPREIEDLTRQLIGPAKSEEFWRAWRETYIVEDDIDRLKKEGFNSVRVPFHWKFFATDDGEGFRLIDRLVGWARTRGMYVILDMHCAPGGQTGTNIDDSWGYPWLYRDAEAQARAIAVWKRIAAHYANDATVLGYDLLNEPIPPYPPLRQYNEMLEPLYRRMAEAIRSVDKNHVLILGGAQWDSNFKVFGRPFDSNVMYTFHKYWTAPTVSVVREYLEFRDKYQVPVWLGESGEILDWWIEKFRKMLEENQVGWCFWPYKKMDSTRGVVSFERPARWNEIVKFAAMPGGTGSAEKKIDARMSPEEAQAVFDDLLRKVRFENEKVNEGYVRALGLKP